LLVLGTAFQKYARVLTLPVEHIIAEAVVVVAVVVGEFE